MKKVLIVTKIGKNYGAVLQAYALQTVVEGLGGSVRILDYRLKPTLATYRILPRVTGFSSFRSFLAALPHYAEKKRSVEAFIRFKNECLRLSEPYDGYDTLHKNPPAADIYLTGSDQVWNPRINFDPAYYLLFADSKAVRASYAASIGISEIPEECKEEFQRRVKTIPFRSVREEDAQNILTSMGIDSVVHIDPTLLLDAEAYDKIAIERPMQKKYILVYLLILPKNYRAYIEAIRSRYPDYEVIDISGHDMINDIGDRKIMDIGPREFIALIRGAQFVLTSSFHGTVFSIIYGRSFASVLPNGTGGRIQGLLTKLGIDKQIVQSPEHLKTADFAFDCGQVRARIQYEQNAAQAYLNNILNGTRDDSDE